jgi:hypothetical protein
MNSALSTVPWGAHGHSISDTGILSLGLDTAPGTSTCSYRACKACFVCLGSLFIPEIEWEDSIHSSPSLLGPSWLTSNHLGLPATVSTHWRFVI